VVVARTPDAEYLQRIVSGARLHGLPEAYIRMIQTVASSQATGHGGPGLRGA